MGKTWRNNEFIQTVVLTHMINENALWVVVCFLSSLMQGRVGNPANFTKFIVIGGVVRNCVR